MQGVSQNFGRSLRQDFCQACWEKSVRAETLKSGKTHWKSKVITKKKDPITAQNRDERVLELLKELIGLDSEEARQESFMLALFLARRRIVALRQEVQQDDGSLAQLYEVGDTEEMLCVKKYPLAALNVQVIQAEIAKKLKGN